MNIDEIKDRLIRLDEDAELTFSENHEFKCYIVGGGALILMGYIVRATHDLDILEVTPKQLSSLFNKYDMNTAVVSYYDFFPQGFEDRAVKIDLPTRKIKYYTLSLEDLVISKLCTTRGEQDILDINNELVVNNINWDILNKLADTMKNTIMSSPQIEMFQYNYNDYVRRNKL